MFNLRAMLRGVDARVRYLSEEKCFLVTTDGYQLRFAHEAQTYYASKRGAAKRAKILGDTYFLSLIKFSDGDVVVDCGANVGELKYWFIESGVNIEYIGYEPAPREYACMKKNVAPSTAHNVGLWNEDGELEFYLSSQMADSSLIQPDKFDEIVRVPVRRLDAMMPDKRIRLLKLEAEGAEPEAIFGCEKILHNIDYVSADVGWERGAAQTNTMPEVTNYLLGRGFVLEAVGQGRLTALYRNTRT